MYTSFPNKIKHSNDPELDHEHAVMLNDLRQGEDSSGLPTSAFADAALPDIGRQVKHYLRISLDVRRAVQQFEASELNEQPLMFQLTLRNIFDTFFACIAGSTTTGAMLRSW